MINQETLNEKPLLEEITKDFINNKNIIIAVTIFIIGLVWFLAYNNWQETKYNAIIEMQKEELEKAKEEQAKLEAPTKYLNSLVEYRIATKEEITTLSERLANLHTEVNTTEMKIRCAREALYKSELNCEEDYSKFTLVK